VVTGLAMPVSLFAQEKDEKLMNDNKEAKASFIKQIVLMQHLFENSVGYVIFPNVGKGAIGVGGAAGNGILYEGGKP
jgi:lipid-binding SYLF domain-containing protein